MSISINRSKAVGKYFTSTPKKPVQPDNLNDKKSIYIGWGMIIFALLSFIFLSIISFVIRYFGIKKLRKALVDKENYERDFEQYKKDYARAEPKPSDEQIDEWMDDDIDNIIEESLRKLDLEDGDYTAKPFIIGGPADLDDTRYALGKDGKIRYSHLNVLIVYLTDHNILTYECVHTLIHGHTLSDITQEFPYKEITNLQIKTVNKKISFVNDKTDYEKGVQQFAIYTSGGNVIEVTYSFSHDAYHQGELVNIGSQQTIKAVRKKLEEYKKRYQKYER
ncbi:hypothetical protein [Brasilonema octagenarum]|uniref:LysM domain-containing protein n=1 Tax=Brasilonema octagenarum UFV-OR1 TaxID=417115 RepID=A0ABX1M2I0_9CYAN|nr:hypothetical protein [Brasilonema octagenarum]NMF62693.1 hypothetical protein [Brasilonema octagenarum UFV-OR1]